MRVANSVTTMPAAKGSSQIPPYPPGSGIAEIFRLSQVSDNLSKNQRILSGVWGQYWV